MTWPAALPGAALRVVRTAAGRRALQAVLLVGGLFALGFLCGERAYAADGVSVGSSSASPATSAASSFTAASSSNAASSSIAASSLSSPSASSADLRSATESSVEGVATVPAKPGGVRDESAAPAKPTTPPHPAPQDQAPQDQAPQAVGPHVVQPVGDVVRSVTEGLTEGLAELQAKVPPLASLPALPALPVPPTAPQSPAWPSMPGVEFPGVPGLPGTELPEVPAVPGQTLPAPVTGAPQPGFAAPASGDGRDGEGRNGKEEVAVVFGPRVVADVADIADVISSHAPVVGGAHRGATVGYVPVHPAPVDQPGGVLGNRSAGDSGSSRHGDAHAVSLNQRPPMRLVPGAAARVDADEIQDRHRDIPVSPA
ncbi:hypothetical protein [Streptomyces cyaneus]|uniref:hypothetical protein n=1 Tax=Streptomyces cyaneus TaxID=1904 RepID=UPI0013E4029D|nr:hypothetical protein [Streptomyces cyaneus]